MDRTRLWVIGATLVAAVVVALGWFAGVSPRLDEARRADAERASVEATNGVHEATLLKLRELDENLPALKKELEALRASLPSDAAIATLLGQLNSIAQQNGVQLTSFTADAPAEFAAAGEAGPVAPAVASGEAEVPEPQPVEPPAGSAAPVPAGSSGFIAIPISVTVSGEGPGLSGFIESLQFGERLFLATDLSITNSEGGSTSTIDGLIYVMQGPEAATPTE